MRVDYDLFKKMLKGSVEIIRVKCDELSVMDAAIGDGDHGVTMLRAMEKVNSVMEEYARPSIPDLLNDIGWALLDIDGGATGPLYGSLFLGLAEGASGQETLDEDQFARMFEAGLESIEKQTKARVGDKTLMDALIPAVASLRSGAEAGLELPAMLEQAAATASQGAQSTRNFAAHYGRAKFQGDRTLGHPDPGSVSMSYVFQGLLDGLQG